MRRRSVLVLALVGSTLLGACGSDAASSSEDPGSEPASESQVAPAPDADAVAELCEGWVTANATGDEEWFGSLLLDPPEELADAAALLVEAEDARAAGDFASNPAADQAALDVIAWFEVRCEGAGYQGQRLLPPLDALPAGMRLCSALSMPADPTELADGITIYGDTTVDDPYDAPMVAVAWSEDASFGGDGEQTFFDLRGVEAVVAPITVFQQTVPDGMGQVVAWTETDGPALGVYGRWWDEDQREALIAIAEAVEADGDRYVIPAGALPDGFAEVHSGSSAPLQLIGPAGDGGGYLASFEGANGDTVSASGFLATPEEFSAMRFLTLEVGPTEIGGREALSGTAWSEGQPVVVAVREDDGSTVRFVGLGSDLDVVEELAASVRPLDPEEWGEAVSASPC